MKISRIALLTLSVLAAAPIAHTTLPTSAPKATSIKTSLRRLRHHDYIRPIEANHIDAPLPAISDPNQIVGIYGNILYPQDQELLQQKRLSDWVGTDAPFPLSEEDLNDISLYILDRFPTNLLRRIFAERVQAGQPLEIAKQEALARAEQFRAAAQKIPNWPGRAEILAAKLIECADQASEIIAHTNPQTMIEDLSIEHPFTWDMRLEVFKQMIEKTAASTSPYFLALQEVTPQALSDLKKTLADRNLQWISFNNLSGKETKAPHEEEILGEATGFTSTLALSSDLEVLKIDLGDLPTESGSVRKILGVRVRNKNSGEVYNIFTTHTDHKIENDIYARTAAKINEFATNFFQDTNDRKFVLGGDLNVFNQLGGGQYIEKLSELFPHSRDFRETDYYAPNPIAWSSFIGRSNDAFSAQIASDGTIEPSALDQILVGNGIELQSASREAGVYNESGQLLDYYQSREEYMAQLKKRITFSDHFFNIVRFR